MALPFFSIDFKINDLIKIFSSIIFPINKNKAKNKLTNILKSRFPDNYISILPSARLGFYLTLKKYFKEGDEIIFSSMIFIASRTDWSGALSPSRNWELNIFPGPV